MNTRGRLCKLLFCGARLLASFGGAPMRPEEIEQLLYTMNRQEIACALPDDAQSGGDLLRKVMEEQTQPALPKPES